MLADLTSAISVPAGLAQILGDISAGLPPADNTPAGRAAHARLLDDLTTALHLPTGLNAILATEGGLAEIVDDLSASLHTAHGLDAILMDAAEPRTALSVDEPPATPSATDHLAVLHLAPGDQRLHLRTGTPSRAVREALRHLENIRAALADVVTGLHPLDSHLDSVPATLDRQRIRIADAMTVMTQALSSHRPLPADTELRSLTARRRVLEEYRRKLAEYRRMLGEINPADIELRPAENVRWDDIDDTAARRGLADRRRFLEASRRVLAEIGDDRDSMEQALAEYRRVLAEINDAETRRYTRYSRYSLQELYRDLRSERREMDDDGGADDDGGPVTELPTERPREYIVVPLYSRGDESLSRELADVADSLYDTDGVRRSAALHQAAAYSAALLEQVVDDLAGLYDDLANRAPATAGTRLLRGCARRVDELTGTAQQLWSALSDFCGADLRAVTGVTLDDLDGVRWSDGTAGTGLTLWPTALASDVQKHSERIDGRPGVWEIGFGAAVSPRRL
uniref:hypothetical protein n=1 Tax=Actinoplanes sp. CA-151224 TaxID=3239904 RepID=UPI003F495A54